jgi:hypothetical protein
VALYLELSLECLYGSMLFNSGPGASVRGTCPWRPLCRIGIAGLWASPGPYGLASRTLKIATDVQLKMLGY